MRGALKFGGGEGSQNDRKIKLESPSGLPSTIFGLFRSPQLNSRKKTQKLVMLLYQIPDFSVRAHVFSRKWQRFT